MRMKFSPFVATAVVLAFLTAGAVFAASPKPAGTAAPANAMAAMAYVPHVLQPANGVCATDSSCGGLTTLEKQMVELVDADRVNPANLAETKGKALPLKWDPRLAQAALAHSEDMMRRHYFSHYAPDGDSPIERVTKLGVQWRSIGENIAKNFNISRAEDAFMNEPRFEANHRGNILNPKFNSIGIGVVRGPDGMIYVTQDFAQE
ncbi:MAG: hypothetical protein KGM47_04115 [Acidobacteriota bacterium]|nr:hypothetical protein [Acidobacteriota bacterium]